MEWTVPPLPASAARWLHLSEFLAMVSAADDDGDAIRQAVERAADAFDADAAAIVAGGQTLASVGLDGNGHLGDLVERVRHRPQPGASFDVPGHGASYVLAAGVPAAPGTMLLVSRADRPFSKEELALLRSMARALSLTLGLLTTLEEERSLRESLQERQNLLERLARIQRSIVHRAPLPDVLHAICEGAAELIGDEVVGLRLLEPEQPDHLVMVASIGVPDDIRPATLLTPVSTGIGGRAVLEERLVVADDYPAAPYAHQAFVQEGLRAAMAAPVMEGHRVVGSLTVATHRAGRRYSQAEQDVLLAFAEHASLALNDARTVDALHATLRDALHQATHDALTGLPNRSVLFEHLEHVVSSRRDSDRVAALFIDLDRFKAVNDSLGHDVGDQVLVEVANRLRSAIRPTDMVGRLAGDEFVVVCHGLHGQVDAVGLADRIARSIAAPISVPGRDVVITASIGVAQAPDHATSADELLRDADMAMYRAKERGCDRIEIFGRNLRSAVRKRLDLEHALRRAIADGEFRVVYQPVVGLDDGQPKVVEALVRWEFERRLVSPQEFIPVAEETGLIVPIGGWVLRRACHDVATWRREVPGLASLGVSVNVSMRQFADDHFVDLVAEALADARLDPSALWLEVTESILLDDVDDGIRTLRALKAMGVHLSIDDFGTGYSSLSYLRRFPVDVLKVDRSFVEYLGVEPEESAILAAIVALARALGVGVVAEGIESSEQVAEVRRLGIAAGQGFHFTRPLPAVEVVRWLREIGTPTISAPVAAT